MICKYEGTVKETMTKFFKKVVAFILRETKTNIQKKRWFFIRNNDQILNNLVVFS